ncbi:MAG: hypothetical protein PHS32_21760 [Rhodoferax sp.]|uniref:hypothetical protein n=1 Tax=Rhodoferax sp. TaxID=50421 RepID=UPI00260C7E0B|nr:hypothetical protein [Rhodoferax sp.]MDD5336374.1 hypothetical protein [Rhodoferax sp.]
MASFIQPSFPSRHLGLARVESAVAGVRAIRRGFDSTRGLSVMLLAAMVSALVVVADQLIDTWADGHLLAAWVALWLIGFAALALFSAPARKLAVTAVGALNAWSERLARARADERLWALAKADPRVMADLEAARSRSES